MNPRLPATLVLAALCACTTSVPLSRDGSEATGTEQPTRSADARTQTLNSMLEQAQSDRSAGNLSQAQVTLEAALRIAPEDARLWLELAEVRFAGGEFEEARTLAERAMSLAGDDPQIIEAARRISSLDGR